MMKDEQTGYACFPTNNSYNRWKPEWAWLTVFSAPGPASDAMLTFSHLFRHYAHILPLVGTISLRLAILLVPFYRLGNRGLEISNHFLRFKPGRIAESLSSETRCYRERGVISLDC